MWIKAVELGRLLGGWVEVLDLLFKLLDHDLPRQPVLLDLIRVVEDQIELAVVLSSGPGPPIPTRGVTLKAPAGQMLVEMQKLCQPMTEPLPR